MKKFLQLLILLFLCSAISSGQNSAISGTGITPQKHKTVKTGQVQAISGSLSQLQKYQAGTTGQTLTTPGTGIPNSTVGGFLQSLPTLSAKKTCQNSKTDQNPLQPLAPEAWAAPYSFVQAAGTYTTISGGTSIGAVTDDEQVYGPYTIPFGFSYNGTSYTQFSVATNGFIGLGATPVTIATLPISAGASNNIISALGMNLAGQTGSELRYEVTGSSPSRTLVVQWTNYRKSAATGDIFNFQIRLTETTNAVAFVYNAFTVNATNGTAEVGIRGSSASDYYNRAVTTGTWAASTAGTTAAASCRVRTATKPANGQTYTWTPLNCNINTFPYTEDFSATLNPCWSAAIVSGTYNWTMATTQSYPDQGWSLTPQNGTHMASYDSYDATAGSQARLKTATMDFTSLSNPSVEFYMSHDAGYSNDDSINIQVSINGGTSWTTLSPGFLRYDASFALPGWTKHTQYLPAYGGMSNVTLAFLVTSRYGNKTAIDNVTIKQGLLHDVGTAGIWAPTKLPKDQSYKWWTFNKDYAPSTETFNVDTKLQVNGSPVVTNTNTIAGLTFNAINTLSGSYSLASYITPGTSFTVLNQTKLATDQNTANDQLINTARACTNDTIYAWDDGIREGAVGYNTGSGWMGQLYYFSAQDTLTSITVTWGTIPGALAGNSLEIYNVSGGLPTTKYDDIRTGINLTAASSNTAMTYKANSPIVLPPGTYWIGVHQSVALAGTYIIGTDQTNITTDNFLAGFAFYSSTGVAGTWSEYKAGGLTMINMIRPNFATVIGAFVSNPVGFTAIPVSSVQVNLGWALNSNGNNVLVAWNTSNTFGNPTGSSYVPGSAISGGGTVLQFNTSTSFNHTGLTPNTVYYYKAWSYNGSFYSGGSSSSARTFCSETPAPWTEDFELTSFPPACWDINTGSSEWARSTAASGYGVGTGCAVADFFNITGATPFALFSLPFNKGSKSAPTLSFDYAYATFSGEVDEMDVYYSTDGGTTFNLLLAMPGGATGILNTGGTQSGTTAAWIPTSAQWATKALILPAGTNMVAFNATSAYGNDLYLDNVRIIEGLAHDVGVSSLDARDVYPAGTVIPVATVMNYGGNIETFTVNMTIGTYSSTKTVTGLGTGLTQQVTFDAWTAPIGSYTATVTTTLAGDLLGTNNTASKAVKVMTLNKVVYGYTTFSTTNNGPISFNLNNPGTLTELVNEYPVVTYPAGGSWANGNWYASIYATTAPFNLIKFNTTTGARTVVGDMGFNMNALSYNPANNIMYGAGYDGTSSNLYTINLTTGAATLVGTIGTQLIINMAINNAGICYATDLNTSTLGTINLSTAAFSTIGAVGFAVNYAQDMEFDRETGELYMAAYGTTGQLRWVNQATGNTMLIGDFQDGAEVTGFAIPYSSDKTLNLTSVLLEGLYNGSGTMRQAFDEFGGPHFALPTADQITVELHNAANYAVIAYTVPAVNLSTSGTATVTIPSTYGGSYYITVKHRNSVETTSVTAVSFAGGIINQSFVVGNVYGGNLGLMIDGYYAIYAGDVNQDGAIDSGDFTPVDNDAFNYAAGYLATDVNGDGAIDSGDFTSIDNNGFNYIGTAHP